MNSGCREIGVSLEIGEDEKRGQCDCCGGSSSTGHGFIYRDGIPYSVYYAAWAEAHKERGVSMAIAIGEWDEGSTAEARTCMGIEAYEGEKQILLRFVGPESSPWPETELLGRMLSRAEALAHPLKKVFLSVAETSVEHHPALRRFLGAGSSAPSIFRA